MSVEDELKKDHADMQAIVDSKQKIIDAQVQMSENITMFTEGKKCTGCCYYYYSI